MLTLPKSTEFNRRIPKQKFYDNLEINPALKRSFVEQIKTVMWSNKIAPSTVNLAPGEQVTELEVFTIQLSQQSLDEKVLLQIDRVIPYHILFLLRFEDKVQACVSYKEKAESGDNAFKVVRFYYTDWCSEEDLQLRLDGLSLDAVYENFVRQIAGELEDSSPIGEAVANAQQREKLQKQIAQLEKKARTEKQPKRKFELVQEIKRLQEELNGGNRGWTN